MRGVAGNANGWRWFYVISIAGSEDSDIYIWDVQTKEVAQILIGHDDVVLGISTHPKKHIIASCGLDQTIRIWVDDS